MWVAPEPATVVRIVDGDTVEVRVGGRVEKLRLLGLHTPETVDPRRPVECFRREASAQAKSLLPRGLRVGLEADPTQGNRDRYARLLRYIWLPGGRNFAEVMIAEGYGFEYTYHLPFRYQDRFQAAQREARAAGRGLWGPACGSGAVPIEPVPGGPMSVGPSVGLSALAAAPCRSGQIKGNRNSGIYHVPSGVHTDARTSTSSASTASERRSPGVPAREAVAPRADCARAKPRAEAGAAPSAALCRRRSPGVTPT